MIRLVLVLVLAGRIASAATPPCGDPAVRPGRCKVPPDWLCLSPELAARDVAEAEALAERCEAEKRALREEGATLLRREEAIRAVEGEAWRERVRIALDAAEAAERAAREAEEEASSRWTTLELLGWVGGAVALGAAAGAVGVWYATR